MKVPALALLLTSPLALGSFELGTDCPSVASPTGLVVTEAASSQCRPGGNNNTYPCDCPGNVPAGGSCTNQFGGQTGRQFDHWDVHRAYAPKEWSVRSNCVLHEVCVNYTESTGQGDYCEGGGGGSGQPPFVMNPGEYITTIEITYDHRRVRGLMFTTNEDHEGPRWGQFGGTRQILHIPSHLMLYSLFGNSGDSREINSLGFIYGPNCQDADEKLGGWAVISESNGGQTQKYGTGTEYGSSATETNMWSQTTTESYTEGFEVAIDGVGGVSGSTTITNEESESLTQQHSEYFAERYDESLEYTFTDPGVLWQWKYITGSICGDSITSTRAIYKSASRSEVPCCLPGAFRDQEDVHNGGCLPATFGGTSIVNICFDYAVADRGTNSCSSVGGARGDYIITESECYAAAETLGIIHSGEAMDRSDRPKGCFLNNAGTAAFNSHRVGEAHNDRAPVCRRPKGQDAPPIVNFYSMNKGDAACPNGDAIASERDCVEALEALGLCRDDRWYGSNTGIPAGCSYRPDHCGDPAGDWHWNTQISGSGRNDTAPLCRGTSPQ